MNPRIASFVNEAAERHGIAPEMVLSRSRVGIRARWDVWKAMRARGYSLHQIGDLTGYHHSTVVYGLRDGARLIRTAPKIHRPRPPKSEPDARADEPMSEGLRIVLANMAAMQAKHEREKASRY